MLTAVLLGWLLIVGTPAVAHAQMFFASKPQPPFKVAVYVRALVTPALDDVTVDVFFSLELPPAADVGALEQDLSFVWPSEVVGDPKIGPPDPALAKQVEALGDSPLSDGRLAMTARNLFQRAADGRSTRVPIAGGAPFVTFIRTRGPMGIGAPATLVRIPWTPQMANPTFMMDLTLPTKG